MPTKKRNHRSAELEEELARGRAFLALAEGGTLEQINAQLDRLRQLLQRVERQELKPEDWGVLRALLENAKRS